MNGRQSPFFRKGVDPYPPVVGHYPLGVALCIDPYPLGVDPYPLGVAPYPLEVAPYRDPYALGVGPYPPGVER